MIILYIIMILLGTILLWKTIQFVLLEEKIRNEGMATTGVVTHIHTTRRFRGPTTDRVTVLYKSNIPGQSHNAQFVTNHSKYRRGQSIPVKYLPEKPDKIIVAPKRGYWGMLIFSILIFLFVLFAVYKIDEMLKVNG